MVLRKRVCSSFRSTHSLSTWFFVQAESTKRLPHCLSHQSVSRFFAGTAVSYRLGRLVDLRMRRSKDVCDDGAFASEAVKRPCAFDQSHDASFCVFLEF